MEKQRILFISDYGPSPLFAGGLVLRSQLRVLAENYLIDYVIISPHKEEYEIEVQKGSTVTIIGKPGEKMPYVKHSIIREILGRSYHHLLVRSFVNRSIQQLNQIIEKNKYEFVFVTLEGSQLPQIISKVNFQNTHIFLQYWDPDEWWASVHNFSNYAKNVMRKAYIEIENNENIIRAIVPSEGMKSLLINRSGRLAHKLQVLYPPAPTIDITSRKIETYTKFREAYDIVIMFTGSFYADAEFNQLIQAVESIQTTSLRKRIGIAAFGKIDESSTLPRSKNIYYGGRITPEEIFGIAKSVDFLFLPYPLNNEELARASFPSKLATYCNLDRNILVISPPNSSLSIFLKQNKLDQFLISTNSQLETLSVLESLLTNSQMKQDQLSSIKSVRDNYFNDDSFKKKMVLIFGLTSRHEDDENEVFIVLPANSLIGIVNETGRIILKMTRHFRPFTNHF